MSSLPKDLAESGTVMLMVTAYRIDENDEKKLVKRFPVYVTGVTWSPTVFDVTFNFFRNPPCGDIATALEVFLMGLLFSQQGPSVLLRALEE